MPVKPTASETEQDFIGRCMSEEKSSFPDNIQRYAVCKSKWDNAEFSAEKGIGGLPKIGDNEEKLLEYLPEPKHKETEDAYLNRCVVILYPEYYDEQQAYSFCADKYQRKITVQNNKQTMKSSENTFEKNRINFIAAVTEAGLKQNGINLAAEGTSFPWDECQAKMMDEYGDKDIADKVCGMIKSKYGK